jgi:hypothetical protein
MERTTYFLSEEDRAGNPVTFNACFDRLAADGLGDEPLDLLAILGGDPTHVAELVAACTGTCHRETLTATAERGGDANATAHAPPSLRTATQVPCRAFTLAHAAAHFARPRCLRFALEWGGRTLARASDTLRSTPLHAACATGSAACISEIVAAGGGHSLIDMFGHAPLHCLLVSIPAAALPQAEETRPAAGEVDPAGSALAAAAAADSRPRAAYIEALGALLDVPLEAAPVGGGAGSVARPATTDADDGGKDASDNNRQRAAAPPPGGGAGRRFAADPAQIDNNGWTPLHHAADGCGAVAVNMLIAAGADPNLCAPNGASPLHIAARRRIAAAAAASASMPTPKTTTTATTTATTPSTLTSAPSAPSASSSPSPPPSSSPPSFSISLSLPGATAAPAASCDAASDATPAPFAWGEEALALIAHGAKLDVRDHAGLTPEQILHRRYAPGFSRQPPAAPQWSLPSTPVFGGSAGGAPRARRPDAGGAGSQPSGSAMSIDIVLPGQGHQDHCGNDGGDGGCEPMGDGTSGTAAPASGQAASGSSIDDAAAKTIAQLRAENRRLRDQLEQVKSRRCPQCGLSLALLDVNVKA